MSPSDDPKQVFASFALDGKAAVITGGGSGIGQAIALEFAAHGAKIRILELSEEHGATTRQRIVQAGGDATVHACDVTDLSQVRAAVQRNLRS